MPRRATVDTLPSGTVHVRNARPATAEPTFELVEELRIGRIDGDGPDVFGEIRDVTVDQKGRIYVLDFLAKEVRVFDEDGDHVWTAGRAGDGPGEMSYPVGLTLDGRGDVWVADAGKSRYTVFRDGAFLEEHTRHVTAGVVPWNGGFDREGRLWDSYDAYPASVIVRLGLVRLDGELRPVDSLTVTEVDDGYFRERDGSWSSRHVPFMPWASWRFDPRGYALSGDAGDYVVRQLDPSGDTVLVLELEYDPIPVHAEELDSVLARLEALRGTDVVVDASLVPDRKPAFETLFVGTDGRIWTYLHLLGDARPTPPAETRLDVFGPDGVYQGVARATSRLEPFEPTPLATDAHVYAAALDELGVQHLVRLRIEPSG